MVLLRWAFCEPGADPFFPLITRLKMELSVPQIPQHAVTLDDVVRTNSWRIGIRDFANGIEFPRNTRKHLAAKGINDVFGEEWNYERGRAFAAATGIKFWPLKPDRWLMNKVYNLFIEKAII